MSDKKQLETEQPRQQNKGWLWGKWIIMIVLGVFSLFICWLYLSPEFICWLRLFPEQWDTNNHIWLQLYLGALAVTGGLVLCKPQIITSSSEKYFITRVLTTGITGGAFALLLPIAVKSTTTGVGGLRHSILLATGGLLAILTLGETRRKNDIDKRKNDQEKDKNDKDHRRQVRAERRERYTKAVEQLGDEKAPVRMGGVYTLVGLVDEWLKDESIKKYEDRLKEGQVIINNLCAYIRSPFTLASHYDELSKPSPTPKGIYKGKKEKFYADKATLDSEADVRLSIIKEIHGHLQGSGKNTPGAWSDFEYDFSGSAFFYPVDLTKSYYKNPAIFNNSHYHKKVDFSGSIYNSQVSFRGSIYKKKVTFSSSKSRSTYKGEADFSGSKYHNKADFRGSVYKKKVTFSSSKSRSTYKGEANFSKSIYLGLAGFGDSTYEKDVIFSAPYFRSTYKGEADFSSSIYKGSAKFSDSTYEKYVIFSAPIIRSTYKGEADFSSSIYKGSADFSGSTYEKDVIFSVPYFRSTYKGEADFSSSIYKGSAKFRGSTYEKDVIFSAPCARSTYKGEANFSKSIYLGLADFSGSTYEKDVIFSTSGYTPTDWDEDDLNGSTYKGKADFSNSIYKGSAKFSDSTYEKEVIFSAPFARSTYKGEADFRGSTYQDKAVFSDSTYQVLAYFSGSIFYSETYFSKDGYSNSPSCFTNCAPQFYDKKNRKNTLFGSHNNDFTVDIDKGYPIDLDSKSIPLNCKFLTSEQKEYLEGKLQEIEKIQNKLLEAKDDEEKARLSDMLRSLYKELRKWREEATTVKVEDGAIENTES